MSGLQYIAESDFTGPKAAGLPLLVHNLPVANPVRRFVAKGLGGGAGTVVDAWKDAAGSGTVMAPASSTAPVIGTSAGIRSVIFNGTSDGLSQNVSLTSPHTMVLVANIIKPTTGNAAISGASVTTGADSAQLLTGVNEIYLNAGANLRVGVGLNSTGWRVYVVTFNGANSVVNINGTEYTGNPGALGRAIFTLGYQRASQFTNIAVAETALYSGAMTSGDRAATVTKLRSIYGF